MPCEIDAQHVHSTQERESEKVSWIWIAGRGSLGSGRAFLTTDFDRKICARKMVYAGAASPEAPPSPPGRVAVPAPHLTPTVLLLSIFPEPKPPTFERVKRGLNIGYESCVNSCLLEVWTCELRARVVWG